MTCETINLTLCQHSDYNSVTGAPTVITDYTDTFTADDIQIQIRDEKGGGELQGGTDALGWDVLGARVTPNFNHEDLKKWDFEQKYYEVAIDKGSRRHRIMQGFIGMDIQTIRDDYDNYIFLLPSGITHTAPYDHVFESTWVTTTDNETITLPLTGTNAFYVDWGDGAVEYVESSSVSHEYAVAGTYKVRIAGTLTGWSFNNAGDKDKIISIKFGVLGQTDITSAYYGCSNLIEAAGKIEATVTNLTGAFRGTGITRTNADIFSLLTNATNFHSVFFDSQVSYIHPDTHANNLLAENFFNAYRSIEIADIPAALFKPAMPISNLGGTLRDNVLVTTDVPDLWNTFSGASHAGCYQGTINASNYGSIPVDWK